MTSRHFATVGVRLLGLAAVVLGVIAAGSVVFLRAVGAVSLTGLSSSDLHLHDTYYVVTHFEDAWLAPGLASAAVGVVLLAFSGRLGGWLARGLESEKGV
jgi:heme/copper-type cytochrome/quinol oxidase subunit 1